MLFPFLQYISPTWYFNLAPKTSAFAYFPDWDSLADEEKALIQWDSGYSSREVSKLDAAYQAWQKGFIETSPEKQLDTGAITPAVADNYRFLRRYFHPLWSYYVLALRLLSLHNPVKELGGFFRSRKLRRLPLYERVYPHETAYARFQSKLMQQAPRVAVIIPTLNRYEYLRDALQDLEQQDYPNFEVIIVDQSEPYRPEFYEGFQLDIRLIRQEEKALWLARNTAIKATESEWIALSEDDIRMPPDWLSHHIKCLDFFQADISSGVFFPKGSRIPAGRNFFRWADQFATGNACLKKEVFRKIGLFDRQFEKQRMGDGEFGLRAYLAGFKSISNHLAWCEDIKAPNGGLRQMGSWDAFRPKSWWAPRPVPSVLYLCRKYHGTKAAWRLLANNTAPSLIPYQFKGNKGMLLLGIPLGILLLPLVLTQVIRSWSISSRMLREGAKIEYLSK